uniref:Uncharacterized protein n=1 Tax=Haptolina brevifila TaxID=156173 RepID=A0A7S2JDL5_9EUKA|eukprot:CAMPEP_0174723138 /NCGR_PEP_ID=MMETSP1094-20130205/40156_1 /TAXON_ID=156173 /ORGANISM="Chrysochromulina brevifilum, Strain UTEX LB 985" /LENGTH=230 /DNA_ID=CAMNT_0015924129 /DNA_START=59 /DNA_END=751 /DNA_ORIENTATION=+
MSSTPRAKPTAKPDAPSPRASKPAADGAKKPKKPKGSKATTAPMEAPGTVKPLEMTEDAAKTELDTLQQKYGALVVAFNDQQLELSAAQKELERAESRIAQLSSAATSGGGGGDAQIVEKLTAELRQSEAANMALQKKVNKLQVEHVSEEEVDQLFYALEVKEQQLEQVTVEKENLEAEVLTARQLSARGGLGNTPQIVEIHHHNDLSDDEEGPDDTQEAPTAPPTAPAP